MKDYIKKSRPKNDEDEVEEEGGVKLSDELEDETDGLAEEFSAGDDSEELVGFGEEYDQI